MNLSAIVRRGEVIQRHLRPARNDSMRTSERRLVEVGAQMLVIIGMVGMVAGALGALMRGTGLIGYVVAGIVGAFLGTLLATAFNIQLPIGDPLIGQIVPAGIGAIV